MKSTTSNAAKTVTAYEQKRGEAATFTLVVKRYDGTVVRRPLLDPAPPEPPLPPAPAPVANVQLSATSLALVVGQTATVAVTLLDAQGTVLTDRSVTYAASNPSIATFVDGVVTALAPGMVSLSVSSEGVTTGVLLTVAAVPTPVPTPVPVPSGTTETITGPLVSVAAVKALGGVWAQYESDFLTYDDPQWADAITRIDKPLYDVINYYDRAAIYYAWAARTGDAKYIDRARRVALDFRTTYLDANGYGIAHHWAMMDGIALHDLDTKGPASGRALIGVGENFAYHVTADPSNYFRIPTDFRINAYAIKSILDAYLTNVSSPSAPVNRYGWPAVSDWAAVLRMALTKILALRDSDGQWRGAKRADGTRVSHPFTVGLLYDALARYYLQFEADVRIPAAIKQSADVMWRDDWLATNQAFKYVGDYCLEGSPSPAGDLNQLIVNGYAFVGKVMGDATFKARADAIFTGGVASRGITGDGKHFNQQCTSAYRYLAYRS